MKRTPLTRTTPLRATRARPRRRPVSPASPAQRATVKDQPCLVCGRGPCQPAHVIPRAQGGCDDPSCVVALCPRDHRAYDEGRLDLLPYLPLSVQAHAVGHVGLARALRRTTNQREAA